LNQRCEVQSLVMEAWLSDAFLDRVRRAYQGAVAAGARSRGRMWQAIDARRSDVHEALTADGNARLRVIFADPLTTDLYFGTDTLCRSYMSSSDGRPFLELALRSGRALLARDQLQSVQSALASVGGNSAVEIGPGVGHCAFFAHQAGIDYTTIDLPLGVVAQACFLGRAVGPSRIWFDGDGQAAASDQIKLLSVARLPERRFDVALNVDSMPEISLAAALAYAEWMNEHARVFVSINHEANPFRVRDVARARLSFARSCRSPWNARAGYVEEMFFISGAPRKRSLLLWLRAKTLFWRTLGAARRRLLRAAAL
jgi:hypothetical protein